MSSTTIRSLRQIRVSVRAMDPSALAFPMAAVRVSRVNPCDAEVLLDRGVGQDLHQVRLPRPRRAGDHEVLSAADPLLFRGR